MKKTPFIGRKEELKSLQLLLGRRAASLVVIKGRRRIGKSRLIEEFTKQKKFLRFEGIAPTRETTAQAQRVEFARQIKKQLGIPGLENLKDWGDLFTVLAEATQKEEVVILLDEITWMGSKDAVFLGKLKVVWEQYFQKNPRLILILCGSISSWIEKNIISSTGFVGRISLKLTLEELSLSECNSLLESRGFKGSAQEKFMAFAVTGGVPWYIEQINPIIPVAENIRRLCFEPDGLFVEEFKYIFTDLFGKRVPICKKIVASLRDGAKSYNEIAQAIGYPSGGPLSEYLEDLIVSGFLEREHNWSIRQGEELKSSKFRIRDNYLRYYLKFIYPQLRKIKKGLFKKASPFRLPGWEGVMGLQVESLVLNNRPAIWKELGIEVEDIVFENPYFQTKTSKWAGCQIDYMIQTRYNSLYVCEIKFSHHPITPEVIKEMKAKLKALKIPKGYSVVPVLIHLNGLTDALVDADYFGKIINFRELLAQE
ncbi:MAG: AAA family ATPase [Verrucomicrobia bacterium]|nr:AAA family ATPase [Verrucomicrobiota bacterium]